MVSGEKPERSIGLAVSAQPGALEHSAPTLVAHETPPAGDSLSGSAGGSPALSGGAPESSSPLFYKRDAAVPAAPDGGDNLQSCSSDSGPNAAASGELSPLDQSTTVVVPDTADDAATPHGANVNDQEATWYRAADLAAALGVSKKTIHRRAAAEQWPSRGVGNRIEYQPPAEVGERWEVRSVSGSAGARPSALSPRTSFTAAADGSPARQKALAREAAVKRYLELVEFHGVERALVLTVQHFASSPSPAAAGDGWGEGEPFLFSTRQLRRWREQHQMFGLNGLVEQKQGVVGRKPAARFLDEQTRRRGQALALGHGSIARAARQLSRDPNLAAGLRDHMHEGKSSKSKVTPSIHAALKVAPLTAALATGTRAARLSLPSVHQTSDTAPGAVYVADDMTPNIYVWEPWQNKLGYRIGRPQVLVIADCGSLLPLRVRVIMRESGTYTSDDVAGLCGDAFDNPGLPNEGLLLEGGIWRGNRVLGHRTGISDEDRVGGLRALGLEVHWARTPSAKWQIEGQFNVQQYIMDRCPGYCGRNEKETLPEVTKKRLAQAAIGAMHPSEFLLQLSAFADHVQAALREYAHERQDGKTLRGQSPYEKWTEWFSSPSSPSPLNGEIAGVRGEERTLRVLAEKDRWFYRADFEPVRVTRQGLRIVRGTGPRQQVLYYHNPALLQHRHGQTINVYFNLHRPEADAVLLAGTPTNPNRRIFIGTAKLQPEISRFHSTPEEREQAFAVKGEALRTAREELRAIDEHLVRTARIVSADAEAGRIGKAIAQAESRAEASAQDQQRTRRAVARAVATAPVTDEMLAAAVRREPSDQSEMSDEQIEEILGPGATPWLDD